MKKKCIAAVVILLSFSLAFSPSIYAENVIDDKCSYKESSSINPCFSYQHDVGVKEILEPSYQLVKRSPWDLLAALDLTLASGDTGNSGCEFDGNCFYSTAWASNLIYQYDINGHLLKEFSIAGVSGLRDLAYNPINGYFYGGAAGGTIWEMDFDSETLINTINGGFESRAIAYNYDDDVIYCSNWGDPVWVVDPLNGAILDQFNLVTTTSTNGFAYDSDGVSLYLYIFDQGSGAGYPQLIYQWDLDCGAMTGYTYDVSLDIGSGSGIAGGLFITPGYLPYYTCIGGVYKDGIPPDVNDWLFVYELHYGGSQPQKYLRPGIYPVSASVENYGTFTETFNVNAKCYFEDIEEGDILYYEDNVTVENLPSGNITIVDFDKIRLLNEIEWAGYYRFEIKTELVGDENPNNNKKIKRFLLVTGYPGPETTHEFTGTEGDNDWYVSDVTITLTATHPDPWGKINNTYISIDNAPFEIYETPVVVKDDGEHILEYFSDDLYGNIEPIQGPFDFKIDQTPPTISIYWDNENHLIIADVDDETSGVAKVEFYINDELVGEVIEPPFEFYCPNLSAGDTFQCIVYDNAGNSAVSEPPPPPPPPTPYLLIGSIRDREINNNTISFHANFVLVLAYFVFPVEFIINEDVDISGEYLGYIGKRFIFAIL